MRKGFTLIEVLVVVLIIGILSAVAVPQYFKMLERSRSSEAGVIMAPIAQSVQMAEKMRGAAFRVGSAASPWDFIDVRVDGGIQVGNTMRTNLFDITLSPLNAAGNTVITAQRRNNISYRVEVTVANGDISAPVCIPTDANDSRAVDLCAQLNRRLQQ